MPLAVGLQLLGTPPAPPVTAAADRAHDLPAAASAAATRGSARSSAAAAAFPRIWAQSNGVCPHCNRGDGHGAGRQTGPRAAPARPSQRVPSGPPPGLRGGGQQQGHCRCGPPDAEGSCWTAQAGKEGGRKGQGTRCGCKCLGTGTLHSLGSGAAFLHRTERILAHRIVALAPPS